MLRLLVRSAPASIVILSFAVLPLRAQPAAELAKIVTQYLGMDHPADWNGVEQLPGFKWAPLPPTMLQNCLPNGDCFARQGALTIGGRTMTAVATGARTMVMTILIRNTAAAIGEAAIVAALGEAGLSAQLARCPIRAGGTNWYRLAGNGASGVLSIQPASARQGEGYVLTAGNELPALQPNQLTNYTEQCAPGAERKPVSTQKPHELLAQTIVALLVPAGGPALYDWKALLAVPSEITWTGDAPEAVDLSSLGDTNPVMLAGEVTYAGRTFSVRATGTPAQVKLVLFEEQRLHPKGEHLLGVVYEKGVAVRLVRCGPVYTESTNNWYSLASPKTRPAQIRQSIRYDGNQVQDVYELRLDGSLPARDPRDRNPGTNGC